MQTTYHPATPRQIEYIIDFARHNGTAMPTDEQIANWDREKASEIINWYLRKFGPLPRKEGKADLKAQREVKPGRYAVEFDGALHFFLVETPDEGRWASFTFVSEQAGDNLYPVKGARKGEVLRAIADDADALARYGKELGVCGVCGRNLTDEESRERGIGPVCAGRL